MLHRFIMLLRQRRNRLQIAALGANTALQGQVDRRSPVSRIEIGSDGLIQGMLVTETDEATIVIGNNVFIGGGSIVDCALSINIEDDVLISHGVLIADSDNHSISYSIRKQDLTEWKRGRHDWSTTRSKPVHIAKGVWIGAKSIILKGVSIGEGAVVGAGSVVTRDVAPYTIVAGNPAALIREIPLAER